MASPKQKKASNEVHLSTILWAIVLIPLTIVVLMTAGVYVLLMAVLLKAAYVALALIHKAFHWNSCSFVQCLKAFPPRFRWLMVLVFTIIPLWINAIFFVPLTLVAVFKRNPAWLGIK